MKPYQCPCCGYANNDMFEDWLKKEKEEFEILKSKQRDQLSNRKDA